MRIGELERLRIRVESFRNVAAPVRDAARGLVRLHADERRHVLERQSENTVAPLRRLSEMAADLPEAPQRECHPGCVLGTSTTDGPIKRCAHVVVVGLEEIEPPLLALALKMRPRFLGQGQVCEGVPRGDLVALATFRELFDRELADRHQHAEAGLASDFRLAHQALLDERAQDLEDVAPELASGTADRLDLREHSTGDEDTDPREESTLGDLEKIPAPLDRAAERPLAFGEIPGGRGKNVQPLPQLRQHRLRREDLYASGRELDRERKAVQPVDDLGDGCGVVRSHAEVGPHRHRALHEEPDGVGLREDLERRESFGVRKIQRRHRELLLAGDAERRPARRDHLEAGTRSEQLADDRSGRKDLLEVVEHEQHPLSLDVIEHARKRHLRAAHLHTEGLRDRRRNELRIADRRERDEESAVAECRRRLLGDAERQSGLSGPSGPGQRDESRFLEEPLPFGDLALAADEARRLRRQERRGAIECPKRRKVGSAPADHELVEALRTREIFQPEFAEIADRHAVAKIRTRQCRGRVGQQHLAAVSRGRDPRRAVHV